VLLGSDQGPEGEKAKLDILPVLFDNEFRHVQRDRMDISTELYDGGYPIMNYHLGIVTVPVMVVGTRQSADEDFCMGRPYLTGLAGWDIEPVMFVLGHFLTTKYQRCFYLPTFSIISSHFPFQPAVGPNPGAEGSIRRLMVQLPNLVMRILTCLFT